MSADNIYIDSDNRIIYLSDSIDKSAVGKINSELLKMINSDIAKDNIERDFKSSPIHLHISSGGGDLYCTWAIIDTILQSKTPIYTYCDGLVASGAFLIFLAGNKRFAGEHSTLMYHQIYAGDYDKCESILHYAKQLKYDQLQLEQYVSDRISITSEQLVKNRKAQIDWYMNPNEAISLGVATDCLC